jgi:tRNA-uridine 2-sulfurtransferase
MNYSVQEKSKGRVLVAMSGGVDSSVAAALLKEQGYDVVGVTMQVWDYSADSCAIEEGNGTCCSSIDVDDARAVADKLDIPFYVINCEAKFRATVIDNFVSEYLQGKTPIPCVNCNTFLKFDHLVQKMKELNCDYLATGHYAQLERDENGQPMIITSSDDWKDQTYFLFTLKPDLLGKLMFPVGSWVKSDLRARAEKDGLHLARKKDSTGICFIGKEGYAGFVEREAPAGSIKPGVLKRVGSDDVIGEHKGIHNFTIGQRKGLGVAVGEPLYVVKLEADGTVWLGEEKYLYTSKVVVKDLNWLSEVQDGEVVRAKVRYAHKGADAKLNRKADGSVELEFLEPQRAITSGQAAVLYRDKHLLGGGWII